ncbi:MAG: hypothetical protein H6Q34_1038, partial [Deltaproteobacteria bacterium]|nr:hypothetical protein [Deltaproteobacteria bacterium]
MAAVADHDVVEYADTHQLADLPQPLRDGNVLRAR